MRLLIDRGLIIISSRYIIYDEQWNIKYYVCDDIHAFASRTYLLNASQNEVAMIQRKNTLFSSYFRIVTDSEQILKVRKKSGLFDSEEYGIDYSDWRLEGDLFLWEYCVYSGDRVVMCVWRRPDAFVIDIDNPADEKAAIALLVAMYALERSESLIVS